VNEEPTPESSLDLTFMQSPHDENFEPWMLHTCLKVDPPRTWYYRSSPNFRTLVILLQIDLASSDEPETICENLETKDAFIFTWSSIFYVGHYSWLRSLIHRLPLNNKAYYLVRTIRCILQMLQLWTINVA
jgi:hypothetical protein